MLKTTQYRILSVLFLLFSVSNLYAQDTFEVTFTVDLSVQEVAVLVNERKDAGTYTATWNAGSLSSGVYMYRLQVGANVITKRMTLIK